MISDRTYDEAAGWLVRQQDEAMDWEGFTAWLEADPCNRVAYDELAMIDAHISDHSESLSSVSPVFENAPANDPEPARWGRWAGLGGGAIAAGLALVLVLQPMRSEIAVRDYESAPGKPVQIALEGGAKLLLAPASHVSVKGEQMTLRGAGYFDVPHQPGRRLVITAGDFTVTDIGTRFSVENEDGSFKVDVAEGSLSVSSTGLAKPIILAAGHGLRANLSNETVRTVSIDPQQVATWRSGELQFDRTPLALVASQISRYSGETITVDPQIAKQPFSGVIAINHGEDPARTLAQILSLDVKKVDGATRLEPRPR